MLRGPASGAALQPQYPREMGESERQKVYRHEARLLGELGAVFVGVALPRVEVRVPKALAEAAVTAWERDDDEPLEPETFEQRAQRHRAAEFSLIGLAIAERGRLDGDEVVVDLSAGLIADAVNASDDLPAKSSGDVDHPRG